MKTITLITRLLAVSPAYSWNLIDYDERLEDTEDPYYEGYDAGKAEGWCDAIKTLENIGIEGIPPAYTDECKPADDLTH